MTDQLREAAHAALHVMEQCGYLEQRWEAEQLRAALADQDQLRDATKMIGKPVAWRKRGGALTDDPYRAACWRDDEDADVTPLYIAPPRREWQSLTDSEIVEVTDGELDIWSFARAIEAALKEKNHD